MDVLSVQNLGAAAVLLRFSVLMLNANVNARGTVTPISRDNL
jgi:hypothetical protein